MARWPKRYAQEGLPGRVIGATPSKVGGPGERAGEGPADRPRVTLNVAMSLDGRIAAAHGRRLRLSDEQDLKRVHRMRARSDAILVGVGTVLQDDPVLTVREAWVPEARNPLRVVLDSRGRTPPGARVLQGSTKTLVFCDESAQEVAATGDSWVGVPASTGGGLDLHAVLAVLSGRGVRSLMVEGGSRVISSFLGAGLVDELFVFIAPVVVGSGAPPLVASPAQAEPLAAFRIVDSETRPSGVLLQLEPEKSR